MEVFICYFFFADVETNECLENNGGCWQDRAANLTACKVSTEFQHFVGIMFAVQLLILSLFWSWDFIVIGYFSGSHM